ncbi:hypothetical protein B0H19DRAFT_1226862 [Mycena capillaripes]|nr:hypothetical protein B0H19DRAFT_1226862 [Mycena capillaripes]
MAASAAIEFKLGRQRAKRRFIVFLRGRGGNWIQRERFSRLVLAILRGDSRCECCGPRFELWRREIELRDSARSEMRLKKQAAQRRRGPVTRSNRDLSRFVGTGNPQRSTFWPHSQCKMCLILHSAGNVPARFFIFALPFHSHFTTPFSLFLRKIPKFEPLWKAAPFSQKEQTKDKQSRNSSSEMASTFTPSKIVIFGGTGVYPAGY